MLKNTLLQQREERDDLVSRGYIKRLDVPANVEYLESGLIKLITGPRRSGKSVLALQLLHGQSFAYLNFDDDQLLKEFEEDAVLEGLYEVYPNFKFILLDEIQNVPDWELWVNKLYRRGFNLVVTGSNARLLSREMGTSLTGRYLQIAVFPFSFEEYLDYHHVEVGDMQSAMPKKKGELSGLMNDYLYNGGYPEVVFTPAIGKNYLATLFDSILLKDIVRRFQIRQTQQLYDLANYLLSNFTNQYSYNQLMKDLNFSSVMTVKKFVGYLSEPYLFFNLSRFSNKIKVQQKAPKKSYMVDNGFIRSRSFELSPNRGRLLENLVFVELLRRRLAPDLELFYYKTRNDKEIDFVCRHGHQINQLIQVCFDASASKVLKRETEALVEAAGELKCFDLLVVTWEEEYTLTLKDCTIHIVPVWKWLLKGRESWS
jgi:uncharacterized protein